MGTRLYACKVHAIKVVISIFLDVLSVFMVVCCSCCTCVQRSKVEDVLCFKVPRVHACVICHPAYGTTDLGVFKAPKTM